MKSKHFHGFKEKKIRFLHFMMQNENLHQVISRESQSRESQFPQVISTYVLQAYARKGIT